VVHHLREGHPHLRRGEEATRAELHGHADGTTYDKHELSDEEWVVVPQIALLLEPFNEATTVLQGSKYVTRSLVLPTISSLHHVTSPGEDMLDNGDNCVVRMHPAINAGRQTLHEDLQRRFTENMDISKVEDFALATVLDPRFKRLDFPLLDQWLDGALTKEMVLGWLRGAWHDPVKQ
jgi:hypothetical protein